MRRGFSTIELLIVLAIVGLLAAVLFPRIRPPEARLMANEIKAMLQQGRYEAIKRNQPVAFVWLADESSFRTRYNSSSQTVAAACVGDREIARKDLSDYRNVAVDVDILTGGIVWLPTGQARTCTGGPMVTGYVEVEGNGVSLIVEASMGGKVTIR